MREYMCRDAAIVRLINEYGKALSNMSNKALSTKCRILLGGEFVIRNTKEETSEAFNNNRII